MGFVENLADYYKEKAGESRMLAGGPTRRVREAIEYSPTKSSRGHKIMPSQIHAEAPGFFHRTQGADIRHEGGGAPRTPTALTGTLEEFKDWYKAYQYTGLEKPLSEQIDPSSEYSWFRQPTAAEKGLLAETDRELPGAGYLPVGFETGEGGELALETARGLYAKGTGSQWLSKEAEIEAEEEMKETLKREYAGTKRQIAAERGYAATAQEQAALAGQAAMARGGFEYSAPAQKTAMAGGLAGTKSMEDIHASALKARTQYDVGRKELQSSILEKESELLDIESQWQTAQSEYLTNLSSLYSGADTALKGIQSELGGLIEEHRGLSGVDPSIGGKGEGAFKSIGYLGGGGASPFKEEERHISPWYFAKKRIGESEQMIARLREARREKAQEVLAGTPGTTVV